jgi:mannose-6-phosphate isomerase-like protein (cupin superfamily)
VRDRTASQRETVRERYSGPEGCWIGEWWNDPEDTAVSVAHVRVEPGRVTAWHRLHDISERYLILSGRGRAEIGDESPRDVGPGDVVVIPPGTLQRITNPGRTELVFLAVCTPLLNKNYPVRFRTAGSSGAVRPRRTVSASDRTSRFRPFGARRTVSGDVRAGGGGP